MTARWHLRAVSCYLNYDEANCPGKQQTHGPDLESTPLDLNGNIYNYINVSEFVHICVHI